MNRRMIAAALTCLACMAGLSACSLTGTNDTAFDNFPFLFSLFQFFVHV